MSRPFHYSCFAVLMLALMPFSACKNGNSTSSESQSIASEENMLKEYVNVPKDKARKAAATVEASQAAASEQAKALTDDSVDEDDEVDVEDDAVME